MSVLFDFLGRLRMSRLGDVLCPAQLGLRAEDAKSQDSRFNGLWGS